jgi:hypothetical protein
MYKLDVSDTLSALYNRINFVAAIFHMSVILQTSGVLGDNNCELLPLEIVLFHELR